MVSVSGRREQGRWASVALEHGLPGALLYHVRAMYREPPSSMPSGVASPGGGLRARLRGSLDQAPAPDVAPGDRLAAVLALLVGSPELSLVFAKRSDALPRHAGEISFPGGLADDVDVDLASTALREAREEIGLDPALPELLGALPPVHTTVSGILVVPFVGMVDVPAALTPSDGEIDEVLRFPVRRLLEVETEVTWERPDGGSWKGWAYELDGRTIWGATGRMVHELMQVLRKELP
jgi:8-oxo-dGTP pyrophosphatase MutT (NUDIX family)